MSSVKNDLMNIYRQYKKHKKLNQINIQNSEFAFFGTGSHSSENLYPCIDYLYIPIKAIFSKHVSKLNRLKKKYHCMITDQPNNIWDNPIINKVFISLPAQKNLEFVAAALHHNKHVFVEKPLCYNQSDLKKLYSTANDKKLILQIGLQRRFSPSYRYLKKKLSNPTSYSFKYCTGAFPEGDEIYDLFIHHFHILTWLFGEVTDTTSHYINHHSIIIQCIHQGTISGQITLTTQTSWNRASEEISVFDKRGQYKLIYPTQLKFSPTTQKIAGIPFEKIHSKKETEYILYYANPCIPQMKNNSLSSTGFLHEISHFASAKYDENEQENNFKIMLWTYNWINQVKNSRDNFIVNHQK